MRRSLTCLSSLCRPHGIRSVKNFQSLRKMSARSEPATLQSAPKDGQEITHNGTTYTTVKEGLAYILVPPNARTSVDPQAKIKGQDDAGLAQNVFYNPIQQFNRDLSVLAIKAFGEDLCERRRQLAEQKGKGLRKRRDKKEPKQARGEETKRRKGNDGSAVPFDEHVDGRVEPVKAVDNPAAEDTTIEILGTDGAATARPQPLQAGVENDHAEAASTEGAASNTIGQSDGTKIHQPRFSILDALSATGLRALRYAQEIPFATSVTANDLLPAATAAIAVNVAHNRLESRITPTTSNALAHMYNAAFAAGEHTYGKYDVIDLDPYGTAAPFLDAAIQAINDGGLLCVTCTDAGVFASCGYVEKTYALYGGLPIKGPHSHEAGLRLILHAIATTAARHGIAIEPLLSLSIDFYARVFVRVRKSPADVKFLAGKTMLVHQCDAGCGAWSTQLLARNSATIGKRGVPFYKHSAAQTSAGQVCAHCGFKTHVAGPMWAGPLHNPFFIERVLAALPSADKSTYATLGRVEGMLTSALDELDVLPTPSSGSLTEPPWSEIPSTGPAASDQSTTTTTSSPLIPRLAPQLVDTHPFFVVPSALAKILHCQAPAEAAIKGALRHAGYKATRSHTKPGCIKTEAPWAVVWEIMREWVRLKAPVKEGAVRGMTAGWSIMQKARPDDEVGAGKEVEADGEADAMDVDGDVRGGAAASRTPTDVSRLKIVFDEVLGKDRPGKRLLRYQLNPRANWGPMNRAKG